MRDHLYGHFFIEEVEALYKGDYCNKEREDTVLQETTTRYSIYTLLFIVQKVILSTSFSTYFRKMIL